MQATASLAGAAEAIWQAVVPALPDFTVEVLPEIDSTNSELMRRARRAPLAPQLLVAEHQSAGRGRLGRAWHSRAGQALTFSLGLPMAPASWSGLSLVVGLVLAETLHPEVRIKWPNDLWLMGRKLGGILVETASSGESQGGPRSVVVGVGINLNRPAEGALAALPAGAAPAVPPAGLAEVEMGVDGAEWLARLVPPLVQALLAFEQQGFAPFAERYRARDALLGRELRLSDGGLGTACGVAEDGALLVRHAGGVRRIDSAEVSVRPC